MTTDSTAEVKVLRYAAFPATADGGNPAGVVLNAESLSDSRMQEIAHHVNYAETAFIIKEAIDGESRHVGMRYFSPMAEVPFCGHATIATAVVLAERIGVGELVFDTPIGTVNIMTSQADGGEIQAAFTSVDPAIAELDPSVADKLFELLALTDVDRDPKYPLRVAYAGNWHPILVLRDKGTFDSFSFDPAAARGLMDSHGWQGTISVLYAVNDTTFEARNIFPVGTITEDPATGSAAASFGGYLRATGLVTVPARVDIYQGRHVSKPSHLNVEIPERGGIVVSGMAVKIAEDPHNGAANTTHLP